MNICISKNKLAWRHLCWHIWHMWCTDVRFHFKGPYWSTFNFCSHNQKKKINIILMDWLHLTVMYVSVMCKKTSLRNNIEMALGNSMEGKLRGIRWAKQCFPFLNFSSSCFLRTLKGMRGGKTDLITKCSCSNILSKNKTKCFYLQRKVLNSNINLSCWIKMEDNNLLFNTIHNSQLRIKVRRQWASLGCIFLNTPFINMQ